MKILKLSPYYYPEQVSSSHLTDDLNEAFIESGIVQENFVPMPSRGISDDVRSEYKDKKNEILNNGYIIVHRFPMIREGKNTIHRAIKYILTNIVQYHKGICAKDIDVVYSGSTPPTQGLLCGKVAKILSKRYGHKVPFVYNLQDVFPDSLVNAKMTIKGSLIWKLGRKIEDSTYRNADKIITISDEFKANIMLKGVPEEKIVVVPNWVNTDNVYPVDRKDNILFNRYNLDRDLFYICYSGNIGHSQNMDLLLEVAKEIDLPDVRFVLIGDGAAKESVQKRVDEEHICNVIMLPFQDYSEIAHVFSLGDVGLVISKPGVGGSSVPSKTYSIMAAGRPVLASFDEDSELCKLINKVGCGVIADAKSKEQLVSAIRQLHADNLSSIGNNGRLYVTNTLNKDKCTKIYVNTIKNSCLEVR
jgi:glycosyltransferase involved in cell wall biosynthesis